MKLVEPLFALSDGDKNGDCLIDLRGTSDKTTTTAASDGEAMRQKLREIRCVDDSGKEALVIEWGFGANGSRDHACREFRLDDGSPVNAIGGTYEHFYSGRLFRPA